MADTSPTAAEISGVAQASISTDTTNIPPAGDNNDTLIAGKYKTEEDLEKGIVELLKSKGDLVDFYKHLESGKIQLNPQGDSQGTGNNNNNESPSTDDAEDLLTKAGLNIAEFEQEFLEKGELSQESYDKLSKVAPREVIDAYLEGQQARAERITEEIFSIAGGKDRYNEMLQWGKDNLTTEEIEYFNDALNSGNLAQMKFAVQAVYARFNQASPTLKTPKLFQNTNNQSSGISGYNSQAEMVADMSNPKYAADPAFRKLVERKLAATTAF